jgi:hypothetical protein
MKKIIITILLLMIVNFAYSQMKMNLTLTNPRDSVGYFMYDLRVTVLAGQVWHVGASNIRVTQTTTGTGNLALKADNPAINAHPSISGANGYQAMTTTSVATGVAIGLNILTFNTSGFYAFAPGTYRLATLRWTKTPLLSTTTMIFRIPPTQFATVVYDSTVLLTYNTNYTVTDPTIVSIGGLTAELPKEYSLSQNYPNPFNPKTSIKFDIPKLSFVTLKIYYVTGQEIEILVNQNMEGGVYEFSWDATKYASGIYFYRIIAGDYIASKKMLLIK